MIAQSRTSSVGNGRFTLSGTLAGVISTFVFTFVHDLLISNIWPMFGVMVVAGALSGACISWSYGLLVKKPALRQWLLYNLVYVAMLILQGIVSLLLFEPATTLAAITAAGDLPMDLLGQALPLASVFTLFMAVGITVGYGGSWGKFGAVLLTSAILVLLLGHNVFILGLVEIPRGSFYLVLKMFGLILLLNVVYVVAFVLLEWRWLRQTAVAGQQVTARNLTQRESGV